jgi:hypothetical protein
MTISEPQQRELVRQLAAVAAVVDKLPTADDRDWLDPRRRFERRNTDEAEARRQLRELRDRLNAMPLEG